MLNHLIFDLDGTLTDPFEGITRCVAHALARFDIRVADRRALACYIGPPLKQGFMAFHGLSADEAETAVAAYRERFAEVGLYENTVYPGIEDVLAARVAEGQHLFVATSKPWCFATGILDHFGLSQYFVHIHGSELDGTRSDKTDLLAYVLDKHGLAAGRALMIGDRRYDVVGATANGMAACGVSYGYGGRAELLAAGATTICESPAALADTLARLTARDQGQ
ncbi:MAG: HAD family hydrolase [Xanthomonadales bacterium]|nr:HAD family hydrolase [Xanthomonadales bacterium]|tara:strand:+ start:240 stop:908 length:669 start_codon:yes stop_codon:yes gene_type:complete